MLAMAAAPGFAGSGDGGVSSFGRRARPSPAQRRHWKHYATDSSSMWPVLVR